MGARKAVDWERIEADYCAGIKSIREIAKENDVTDTAIRKKARHLNWARSLSAKIEARAIDLVRREEVRTQVRTENAVSEREIIEASAQAIVNVKLSHRKSIGRQRALVEKLLAEVEAQTDGSEDFARLGELLEDPDERGIDKLNEIYKKVIATPQRIDSIKKLAETLKHLIYLEREAFDIVPAPTPQDNAMLALAKSIQGNTLPIFQEDDDDDGDKGQ